MRHIRKTDDNVNDHRFRCRAMYPNKQRPTFCGDSSGQSDVARKDALHFIRHERLRPDWAAALCPACRSALVSLARASTATGQGGEPGHA